MSWSHGIPLWLVPLFISQSFCFGGLLLFPHLNQVTSKVTMFRTMTKLPITSHKWNSKGALYIAYDSATYHLKSHFASKCHYLELSEWITLNLCYGSSHTALKFPNNYFVPTLSFGMRQTIEALKDDLFFLLGNKHMIWSETCKKNLSKVHHNITTVIILPHTLDKQLNCQRWHFKACISTCDN